MVVDSAKKVSLILLKLSSYEVEIVYNYFYVEKSWSHFFQLEKKNPN